MKKGFTLLEVLITVALISLLTTIFIVASKTPLLRSQEEVKTVNMSSIQQALSAFVLENHTLPLKKRISYNDLSADMKQYVEDTLQQEEGTSQIHSIKEHLYTLDAKQLQPYLKTNQTLEDMMIVDDISPYLRGFLFSKTTHSSASPLDAFLEDKDDQIAQISRGYDHVLVLLKNGDVYGWGANNSNQLGDGTNTNVVYPTRLHQGISYMLGSGHHTFAKKTDGTWISWGRNDLGQLGDGTFSIRTVPKPLTLPVPESDIKEIKSKGNHTLLLLKDGRLLSWGYNTAGQLGLGNNTNQHTPSFVKKKDGSVLTDVVQIETGNWSSFAKTKDGTWYAWGRNFKGSLGDGTETNRNTPVEMTKLSPYYNLITSIDSGTEHSLFLLRTGEVLSVGGNPNGQLGSPSVSSTFNPVKVETENGTLQNITSIMAGNNVSAALSSNGKYYLWGDNTYGELCHNDSSQTLHATEFPYEIHKLTVQGFQIFFTQADGNLWGCGANTYGQMGDGTTNHHFRESPSFQTHEKKDL